MSGPVAPPWWSCQNLLLLLFLLLNYRALNCVNPFQTASCNSHSENTKGMDQNLKHHVAVDFLVLSSQWKPVLPGRWRRQYLRGPPETLAVCSVRIHPDPGMTVTCYLWTSYGQRSRPKNGDHQSHGYGSIPINTIFSGMNIHLPAILMFTRGTRFWHTATWLMF